MKPATPPPNIVVGLLYFIGLLATAYLIKKVFHLSAPAKPPKFTSANYLKGLRNPAIASNISPIPIIIKSFLLRHTLVGSFLNSEKLYLLKQVIIISIILVACININTLTLWPVALAIVFSLFMMAAIQFFRVPLRFKHSIKTVQSNEVDVQSGSNLTTHRKIKVAISHRYLVIVGAAAFAACFMITSAMFSVLSSVSNLGALNIGSAVIVVLIDQLAFRVLLGGVVCVVGRAAVSLSSKYAAEPRLRFLGVFQILFFETLCQELLLQKMNEIFQELGEPSDADMGASPTRKKTYSPSKVPKAQPLYFESETQMNFTLTKREGQQLQRVEEEEVSPVKTPIKDISLSEDRGNQTIQLTTLEKQMFLKSEGDQQNIVSNFDFKENNVYFSIERPDRVDTEKEETVADDGLILMEAELNTFGRKDQLTKCKTLEVNFSPSRRRRQRMGGVQKKRQLIITGNSPYLQYLPDMMKKKKDPASRKGTMPCPSITQQLQLPACSVSRKVL